MLKFIIGFLFFISSAFAETLTVEQKLSDFNQLNYMIQSQYGPYKYKQEKIGLNLLDLKQQYRQQIEKTTNNPDFYYLLVRYVAEFRDGHFGIYVPSTYVRSVPIMSDMVSGKVLIDSVNRAKLNKTDFPFERGDEIVRVDGQPISDFIDQNKQYVSYGSELGRKRIAAQLVFRRPGAIMPVPTKEVLSVEIRRGTSTLIETVQLKWQTSGVIFDEASLNHFMQNKPFSLSGQTQAPQPTRFRQLSSREIYQLYLGGEQLERSYQCSGATRIDIPKDAVMVVNKPFVAYYHPTEKGNVGYLRIPHYSWGDELEAAKIFQKYVYAISIFEQNTVGLIIDQDHNCGGSVDFVEDMVGLFVDKPVDPLIFQLRASKKSYMDIRQWQNEMTADTLGYKHMESLLTLVKNYWQKGEYLTPKVGLTRDKIYPAATRYTKPIVMTIDELSGSGGDAFPSMMKGYQRAILLGQTTGGLGGHINAMPDLNNSAMKIHMTMSLFYRPDGVAVENNGAVPDVEYVPNRDDFLYGYKGYQKFYLKVLLDQIQKNRSSM